MGESRIDIPQTPQVTEKAEDEGGKGTQSISSSIRQTPEVTEKTEDEGRKGIFSMQKSIVNRPGSSQPPEKANYQVPHMFPLGLFHRLPDWAENIESKLLALDRQCDFEELVKNMMGDTQIREWYVGVESRYSEEELGRMMARSGLLLLEFLRRKNKRRVRHISLLQAEQLQGKGVKFAPNEGLLDKICFNSRNRTLYLPTIKMDGGTAVVLRNLVRFEASKQEKRPQPLMSYVDLMERLIDTPEDVQALRDADIIECHLATNNHVASVCNGMRKLLPNKIKYEPIDNAIYDVRRFYTSKCRIMYTEFKQNYCSKPWIVLSVISACILFALAGFQTYLAWEQVRLQRESMPKT